MHSQQDFYKNQFIFISIKFLIIARYKEKNEKKNKENKNCPTPTKQKPNSIPFTYLQFLH